jgi:hypothetical protein
VEEGVVVLGGVEGRVEIDQIDGVVLQIRLAERLALSKPTFQELLFGALSVPDISGGFLVGPALLPRFAEAASG